MAIERKNRVNKFDADREILNAQQSSDEKHSKNVIKQITSESGNTKLIHDKNGRVRRVKVKEPRKAFQVYIPKSVFEKLEEKLNENGKSRNSVIEELVRNYINE